MTDGGGPRPFELHISVEPPDIDRLGHVNNVVYVRWIQEVAAAHWESLTTSEQREAIAWVVVRHEIDYERPALRGDEITARTWVGLATRTTFERHTEILRTRDERLLVRARTLWCPVHAATGRLALVGPEIRRLASNACATLARMTLLDLSARDLLDRFASSDPTPGGGSAAALSGCCAAALVTMVSTMPKTRTGAGSERERLDAALGWAREAGSRLRSLVDEDARAYDAVVAAHRMPKRDDGEKAARAAAIAAALAHATEVPMRTAEACLAVLKAAQEALAHGNPNAVSDVRTAGAMAWAGLVGAVENVRINLGAPGAETPLLTQIDAILDEGRVRVRSLGVA